MSDQIHKPSLANEFTRNFIKLVSGNMIVLALPLFTAPVNSRLYDPKDYGLLGIFLLVVGFFTALSTSGFCHGIIVSSRKKDIANFFQLSIYTTAVSVLLSLLFIFMVVQFGLFFQLSTAFAYFVPVHVLLQSCIVLVQTMINKMAAYGLLTKGRIIASVSSAAIQISLGYAGMGFKGLVITYVTSSVLTLAYYFISYRRELGIHFRLISHDYSMMLLRGNMKYLKYSTPTEMINNLIHQVPVYLFTKLYEAEQLGAYIFSERLLGMPFSVMNGAFVEIFRKAASDELRTENNCRTSFNRTLKLLLLIAVPGFTIIAFASPLLFGFIFGEEWVLAGKIASALSLLYFARFVVSPLTYVFVLKSRQKEDFILHVLLPFWIILVVYSAHLFGFTAIADLMFFYSACVSMIYILYFYKSYQYSR